MTGSQPRCAAHTGNHDRHQAAARAAANRSRIGMPPPTASVAVARLASLAAAAVVAAAVTVSVALAIAPPAGAIAAASDIVLAQPPASFDALITNLRNWIVGLLVGLATLFVTIGGIRLLAADGDPGEVERAKRSIRNGLIGYALAALAPLIMTVLRSLVG